MVVAVLGRTHALCCLEQHLARRCHAWLLERDLALSVHSLYILTSTHAVYELPTKTFNCSSLPYVRSGVVASGTDERLGDPLQGASRGFY